MTQTILEAIARCDPEEPLQPGDRRWMDFDAVRGIALQSHIGKLLRAAETARKYEHIALAGHRGSGKSTELNRVIDDAKSRGYLTLYAGVTETVDPNEISFGDVFLLMARLLEHRFRTDARLEPLPEKLVSNVNDWFRQITRIADEEIERTVQYGGGAGLGIETPLAKLLFSLNVLRRSTSKNREEIRLAIEQYPQELLNNLKLLLDEAHRIAKTAYPGGILFVLDNIDRYAPEIVSSAILRNADLFNRVNAHTIFTVPISLAYNPRSELVGDRLNLQTLPMIPVFKREPRQPNRPVIDRVIAAIYRRVDPALFADESLARDIARLSGGCPRDLLRLLKTALVEADERIEDAHVRRAAAILRTEMARRVTFAQFDRLASAHLDDRTDPDEDGSTMLFRRDLLEYDGEGWVDAHPLLQDTEEFRRALEQEKARRMQAAAKPG
jgi:hypothetical protein